MDEEVHRRIVKMKSEQEIREKIRELQNRDTRIKGYTNHMIKLLRWVLE